MHRWLHCCPMLMALLLAGSLLPPSASSESSQDQHTTEQTEESEQAAEGPSLAQAGMVRIPAGSLSLSDAVRLLRDGGRQRILLGLGVHGEQSVDWDEDEELSWWQALDRLSHAFSLTIHGAETRAVEQDDESGGWVMSHHHQHSARRGNDPVTSTLRTLSQPIALSYRQEQAAPMSSATFGPWRLLTDELIRHEARMLSGTQRWIEIPYRILGEPRFADYDDIHATVTWEHAENAAGSKRILGEPSISTIRNANRRQLVRRRNSTRAVVPDTSASIVVSGLGSGDRSIILQGTVRLEAFQHWQQEVSLTAQEWKDIDTPDGPIRVLLHQERELDEALFAGLNLSVSHANGPALVWVITGQGRSIPTFTLQDAAGNPIRNSGSRSTSRRNDSLQSLKSLRMIGDMQGPFTLTMEGQTAENSVTLPLRLEVALP